LSAGAAFERRVLIGASLADQLSQLSRAARPQECCGLLIGRRTPVAIITRLEPCANLHPEPERFFTLDPARQIALLRELRGRPDEVLLGLYHSHPDGPARPSPRDLGDANDADLLWLVIDGSNGEIGAFQPIADTSGAIGQFAERTLIVTAR
jgi:proteasome lid subunit RPN8/RPN11